MSLVQAAHAFRNAEGRISRGMILLEFLWSLNQR
jgi:hypothetical protein